MTPGPWQGAADIFNKRRLNMEDLLTPIMEHAQQEPMEAALELGRGLMRGNASEFKQGYNSQAATTAVERLIDLSAVESIVLLAHLTGFALGMREDRDSIQPA